MKLKWTKDIPLFPGYYWVRKSAVDKPEIRRFDTFPSCPTLEPVDGGLSSIGWVGRNGNISTIIPMPEDEL